MIDFSTVKGLAIPVLLNGYTKLDYIESTGTQFIDTGYVPKSNPRINMLATLLNDDNKEVCGTSIRKTPCWVLNFEKGSIYYRYYSDTAISAYFDRLKVLGNKLDYSIGQTLSIGGTTYCTATSADFSNFSQTIRLFAARESTTSVSYYASMRLYSCQIYDNETLVRDFVPCKNASGEAGLYDLVNDQFYENAGSGSFVVGADVAQLERMCAVQQIADASGRVLWSAVPSLTVTIQTSPSGVTSYLSYMKGNEEVRISEAGSHRVPEGTQVSAHAEVAGYSTPSLYWNGMSAKTGFASGGKMWIDYEFTLTQNITFRCEVNSKGVLFVYLDEV